MVNDYELGDGFDEMGFHQFAEGIRVAYRNLGGSDCSLDVEAEIARRQLEKILKENLEIK